MQQNDDQYEKMIKTPIPKLILTLAVPTIIGMLITSAYNMADAYFVSKLGTSASGAIGIVFSLFNCAEAACRIAVPAVKAGHTVDYCDSAEQKSLFGRKNLRFGSREKCSVVNFSAHMFPPFVQLPFRLRNLFFGNVFSIRFTCFFQERVYRYALGGKMHPHSRKAEFRSTAHPPYDGPHPRFFSASALSFRL